jgi:hypothetical protein
MRTFGSWGTSVPWWQRRVLRLVVVGIATLGALVWVHDPRVYYWSDTHVFFIAPPDPTHRNAATFTTDGVIATVGLVGRLVETTETASGAATQTTLLAQGVTEGHQVRQPNSGGQWVSVFDQPYLDVQVVAHSPERVRAENDRVVGRIRAQLDTLQNGVHPRYLISTTVSPSQTQVLYASGDSHRAMAGVLLVGFVLMMSLGWPGLRRRPAGDSVADHSPSTDAPRPVELAHS